MNQTIGFIGGGNMATSLIGGLISKDADNALFCPDNIIVFEPSAEKAQALAEQYKIQIAASNQALVNQADVVVIAVKPQVLQSVLEPLQEAFQASNSMILSIVAGITSQSIEQWLQRRLPIVRVMPNTPALVGAGASGLYANDQVSEAQRRLSETIMNAVGQSAWVNTEQDIDSITALSGSGPAYFMLFMQGLIEAAVNAGLEESTAKQMAVQTAAGAAQLVASSDTPLQTLIDNVTSPGGTTEQALNSFNAANLTGIVQQAFDAAKRRSQELADELG